MKKIFAFIVCAVLLICAMSLCAFAEGETVPYVETTVAVVETSPAVPESASGGEISGEGNMPDFSTEAIVGYIKEHFEEISVIVGLIASAFYNIRKHKLLNRSISATNNNAITVAENSDRAVADAVGRMENIAAEVAGYKEAFATLMEEYRASEEEKKQLSQTLGEAMNYIKNAKLANVEFANELADLLVLANIPNSKKEELYSRHLAAVNAIAEADKTEVINDEVGKKA